MGVVRRDDNGVPTVWCDPCITELVDALNANSLSTVASCCGHGHRPGSIVMSDGRVLVICPDLETADSICDGFPDINGDPVRSET